MSAPGTTPKLFIRFWIFEWSKGEVFSMFWVGRIAIAIDHSRAYYKRGWKLEWY